MRAVAHGNYSTYSNGRCRCAECRAAWAAYMQDWTARQTGVPPDVPHGTANAYRNYRCRCITCRAAWAASSRAWRARRKAVA